MKHYTVPRVAEMLDVSHKTIYRRIKDGELRAIKFDKRWVISEHEILNYITKKIDNGLNQ